MPAITHPKVQSLMKRLSLAAVATCALALAMPVAAQDFSPEAMSQVQPADPAGVTDAEIATFITVVMEAEALEADTALTDQDRVTALFNSAIAKGMPAERFVAVSMAIGADAGLQQRVQAAVIAMMPAEPEG